MQHSGVYFSNFYFYLCYVKYNFLYSWLCQMKWCSFIAVSWRCTDTSNQCSGNWDVILTSFKG